MHLKVVETFDIRALNEIDIQCPSVLPLESQAQSL